MSRTGSCLDNAVAESWFASLKVELVHRQHYRTRAEARTAIFAWIAWYNRVRLHSANNYLSPIEWEHQHAFMSPLPPTAAAQLRCPPPGGRSTTCEPPDLTHGTDKQYRRIRSNPTCQRPSPAVCGPPWLTCGVLCALRPVAPLEDPRCS